MPSPTPTPSPHSEHIASVMARAARKAPDDGEAFSAVAQLLRGYDAALIAQHTAELTARLHVTGVRCEEAEAELARWKLHAENQERRVETLQAELTARIRELEAANLELGLELKRGELGVTTVALMASKERIADLKAQLAASAQREASARAEALREAMRAVEAINEDHWCTPGGIKARVLMVLQSRLSFVRDEVAPPPPRVDAWIPVESRQWKHGAAMWGYDRFYDKTGEVYFDSHRSLDDGTQGRFVFADGDDDCDIVLVHELPEKPAFPPEVKR